jgi:hypothetical protein
MGTGVTVKRGTIATVFHRPKAPRKCRKNIDVIDINTVAADEYR